MVKMKLMSSFRIIAILFLFNSCSIIDKQECYSSSDCSQGERCIQGKCHESQSVDSGIECIESNDCDTGQICRAGVCVTVDACNKPEDCEDSQTCIDNVCVEISSPKQCPADMVNIDDAFCIDRYEASRIDAANDSGGATDRLGTSRKGVMPWFPVSYDTAKSACENAGKRLCKDHEWQWCCQNGHLNNIYAYGDDYIADICNGIDAFCDSPSPGCRGQNDYFFKPMPTGSFNECMTVSGIVDMNGNVWEWVEGTEGGINHLRGGAYNCSDSKLLHECGYKASDSVSARGFRCCSDL